MQSECITIFAGFVANRANYNFSFGVLRGEMFQNVSLLFNLLETYFAFKNVPVNMSKIIPNVQS